jgi:hypothetical protein
MTKSDQETIHLKMSLQKIKNSIRVTFGHIQNKKNCNNKSPKQQRK